MSLVLNGGVGGSGSTQFGYVPSKIITQLPYAISFHFKGSVNSTASGRLVNLVDGTATLNSTPNYLMGHGVSRSLGPVLAQTIASRLTGASPNSATASAASDYTILTVTPGASTVLGLNTSGHGYSIGEYIRVSGTFGTLTGLTDSACYRVSDVNGAAVTVAASTSGDFTGGSAVVRYAAYQPEFWNLVVCEFTDSSPRLRIWSAIHGKTGLTTKSTFSGTSGQYPVNLFSLVNRLCVGAIVQANDAANNHFRGEIANLAVWDNSAVTDELVLDLNTKVPTIVSMGTLAAYYPFDENTQDQIGSNHFTMFGSPTVTSSGPTLTGAGGGGSVIVSGVSDPTPNVGQSITINGETFGVTQGTGKVYISPTNNVNDVNRVQQTVTSWGDAQIVFTTVRGSLDFNTPYYLFVLNDSGASNTSGFGVTLNAIVSIQDTLVNLQGQAVANETGLTAFVWTTVPSSSNATPAQILTNQSSNGSGQIDWIINGAALNAGDPVWVSIFKDGTPFRATMKKVVPTYE